MPAVMSDLNLTSFDLFIEHVDQNLNRSSLLCLQQNLNRPLLLCLQLNLNEADNFTVKTTSDTWI